MKIKLTAKTHKGKNKIREAGTDEWMIVSVSESTLCLGGGPGVLIQPNGEADVMCKHRRWIERDNDKNFDFEML